MLQYMRKLSKSWVSTVLMGGLALSFALWGIGDIFRGSTSTAVATVGGTKIDQTEFQRDYRNTIRMVSNQQHTDVTPEEARKIGLPKITLERMMGEAAINNYTSALGLSVSDATVTQQIRTQPAFNGIAGTFDHATFVQAVNRLGYSEDQFVAIMRHDLARNQLNSAAQDGLSAAQGYIGAIMAFLNEARTAEYVIVTPAMIGTIAPPGDATLAAYVKAHPGRFSTPEYRSVTFAAVGPEDVTARVTVTDKQLHDAYDTHKADYVVAEKRDADQISFPTEAEAKAARAKLDAGTTFDALAAQRKLSDKAISMGTVAKAEVSDKAIADALFALPEGGITQPVKGPFGSVLVRVRKITPPVNKSFDDVKVDLEKLLKTELAASLLVDTANKFTDSQGGGADVAQAGRDAGMRVTTVAEVDAKGLAPDGSKANVPAGEFLQHVFVADVGNDGDAFQTSDGHWYAVKVNGVTPPKLKSLDVVRAQVVDAWMQDARAKALAEKAQQLATEANTRGSLDGAGSVQTTGRLTRNDKSDVFSPKLLEALFSKPAGAAVTGPLAKGEGYIVARSTAVNHPPISQADPNYRGIGVALSRQVASDLSDALAAAEKTRQGTRIDQKLFDSAIGGET